MQDINPSRRSFVQGGAVLFTTLAAGGAFVYTGNKAIAAEEAVESGTQYAFWCDSAQCIGCGDCTAQCRAKNNTPDSVAARRWVLDLYNDFGDLKNVSTSCMHCALPSCASVCPAGAITKRNDGIVVVDQNRCIGCKYCHEACPFAVPHYTSAGMDKCDCCIGAGVQVGQPPHCVTACKQGALHFGTVEELLAESAHRAQPISASSGPACLFS